MAKNMEAFVLKPGEYTFRKDDGEVKLSYRLNGGRFCHEIKLDNRGIDGENLAEALTRFDRADKHVIEARIAQVGSTEEMKKGIAQVDESLKAGEITLEEAGQEVRAIVGWFNKVNRGYLPEVIDIGPKWASWRLHTEESSLKRPWMVLEDIAPGKQVEEPYRAWAVNRNLIAGTLAHSLRRTVSYKPLNRGK